MRDGTVLRLGMLLIGGIAATVCGCKPATQPAAPFAPAVQLRRPVAMAVVDSGTRLLVANARSGSVSEIDTTLGTVVSETSVGKGLSDLVPIPDSEILLAADDEANELIAVRRNRGTVRTVGRVSVPASPRSITVSPDGTNAYVACDWAQRVAVIDISSPARLNLESAIDVPFSPGLQRFLPDGQHLVVLDAFGGHVGLLDVEQRKLVNSQRWTAAHNLRGLAFSADNRKLLIPHQLLMSEYATTPNGVHWGQVLMNVLRVEAIEAFFSDKPVWGGSRVYLGDQDDAAGDPTGVVVTGGGQRIVAFAGTSEVAISDEGGEEFSRVTVGRRPTALALSPNHETVYVANTFGDSISVVDVSTATTRAEISLGPQAELTAADQGELLFHDANLSRDRWFSCNSCHTDGHSNGLLNDNFADGSEGSAKRVLSLLGVADTHPWAWNGKRDDLAEQVRASIDTTMRGPEPTEQQIDLLIAYLETLQPPPSLTLARGELDTATVAHGANVFELNGCANCHPDPHYTTAESYDVGVHDPLGNLEFNPPSLRGVSQRDRLFHDNRAEGLVEVFREHQHGLDEPLGDHELKSLVAFLENL